MAVPVFLTPQPATATCEKTATSRLGSRIPREITSHLPLPPQHQAPLLTQNALPYSPSPNTQLKTFILRTRMCKCTSILLYPIEIYSTTAKTFQSPFSCFNSLLNRVLGRRE